MLTEFRAVLSKSFISYLKIPVRFKSQRRNLGKPPGVAKSLAQRLEEENYEDPKVCFKVNIGFLKNKVSRREVVEKRLKHIKNNRSDPSLEMAARNNSLILPLEDVEEEWALNNGPEHIKAAAEHYGIFDHLFGDAVFLPVVPLRINFNSGDEQHFVYRGNYLTPSLLSEAPQVKYQASPDSLWTLLMSTPDGHLQDSEKEYIHWLIGNIQGNDINNGEVLFPFLQPFPMKGLGYLRYIFVLFKQECKMDYSNLKNKISSKLDLSERTFSTYDFYRRREAQLTPAGLAWFQADWDPSVTDFFHKKVEFEEEPVFVYDFPKPQYRKQEWYPKKRPFNLYLDRYRDEKEIAKEYLVRKLKTTSPFAAPLQKYPFPNAVPFKENTPSWLKTELRKRRLLKARAIDYA
ncbi:large ribosomal subunit protein mL38 [Halyomorpha halys]|uniref:large ribosomal subunit protein mL38 n=1 Tax=Halyomorpha halys TaxID=286706 RepID=UPI0006D4D12A|nr:39S ribosomal protein L38, mitochondrial [Halyomorpha halys]